MISASAHGYGTDILGNTNGGGNDGYGGDGGGSGTGADGGDYRGYCDTSYGNGNGGHGPLVAVLL